MLWKSALFPIAAAGMAVLVGSCQTNTAGRLDNAYHAAVVDAALTQEDEITDSLLSLSLRKRPIAMERKRDQGTGCYMESETSLREIL